MLEKTLTFFGKQSPRAYTSILNEHRVNTHIVRNAFTFSVRYQYECSRFILFLHLCKYYYTHGIIAIV